MARKHEEFTYSGYKYSPESFRFYMNGKYINLDAQSAHDIACMVISGRKKEAEDTLKRILRNAEKETNDYICIGFYGVNSDTYYFTQDLKCNKNNLQDKLHAYKEWKRYIKSKNCDLSTHTVTSGLLTPDGKMTKEREENVLDKVDLSRPCIIRLVNPKKQLFCMERSNT